MHFVIIELAVIRNHNIKIPVLISDLPTLCWIFSQSEHVKQFKVIDNEPVRPEFYGFNPYWEKWVVEFDKLTFKQD